MVVKQPPFTTFEFVKFTPTKEGHKNFKHIGDKVGPWQLEVGL